MSTFNSVRDFVMWNVMKTGVAVVIFTAGINWICIPAQPIIPAEACTEITPQIAMALRVAEFGGLSGTIIGSMVLFLIGIKGKKN